MRRQWSQCEEPEQIAADRSEIDAVYEPHLTRGYWSRALNYLKEYLAPNNKILKFLFPRGRAPRWVESSIYAAATRKRMRVSVYVRGAAVYVCYGGEPESYPDVPVRKLHCQVCNGPITPKPGTGEQYVCAGTTKKKSECQKILRYAREHGISIAEAKRRREALRRERDGRSSDR